MKVLVLTHRIPYPPDKGEKIRFFHLLSHLARKHEVDLVTHADDPRDLRHVEELEALCRSVSVFRLKPWQRRVRALTALLGGRPLSVGWMTSREASRRVRCLLDQRRHDLVIGCSAQVAAYLAPRPDCPVVLDFVDVDSQKWADYGAVKGVLGGWLNRLEARRLAAFERAATDRADRIVLTTERESEVFRNRIADVPLEVITNGVEVPESVPTARERDSGLMIFVGTMDYDANVLAAEIGARDVLPIIRNSLPQARFRIVGRNPSTRVRRLAALPGVEVTGAVADPGAHLSEAALALLPLQIVRGVQNKVLEALAYGLPVVAPSEVARCLHASAANFVFCAENPAGLALEAQALLGAAGARQKASEAGREYVRRHHDWRRIGLQWDRVLYEVSDETIEVGDGG